MRKSVNGTKNKRDRELSDREAGEDEQEGKNSIHYDQAILVVEWTDLVNVGC